jgi:UDP-glucose 4-epimerase
MKVLVTGVAGFMGSHLADEFLAKGHQVVGIDNLLGGYAENVPSRVEFHELDLVNLDDLHAPFKDVELVVHTACTAYEGLSVFSPALIVQNRISWNHKWPYKMVQCKN